MTLATQGILFGVHYPTPPGGDTLEGINLWEKQNGRRMDVVVGFRKWGSPSGQIANAKVSLAQACGHGRVPMVTWMPMNASGSMAQYTLDSIYEGCHDEYLKDWAQGLAELKNPVHVRLMHEMNGNWYPWSGTPELYVKAWRHIVSTMRSVRPNVNLKFVWCVNASDQPKTNDLEKYWPGHEYVDVLGIDGYNNYGGWRSFSDILGPAYARVCRLDPGMPVWICETGSAEGRSDVWPGTGTNSKADWIRDMFTTEGMERVKAVCWLDQHNTSSFDWRIGTSSRSREAMRAELRKAAGYAAAPGPYVPPIPDRVRAECVGPGVVSVGWRVVPSYCRGYRIRVTNETGFSTETTVLKPRTSGRLTSVPSGRVRVTVSSFTRVCTSRRSEPVEVYVARPP